MKKGQEQLRVLMGGKGGGHWFRRKRHRRRWAYA
jgi:hypothetical protein